MNGALNRVGPVFRRALHPPLQDGRFWLVQGLVIIIAVFHEGADATSFLTRFGIPDFATVALFLVPIVYAALNFGLTGSLATATWVTLISLPDFFVIDAAEHHASDAIQILVVDAVAIFVGYRVDQERLARLAAEAAGEAYRAAEARTRLYAGRILHAQEDERRRLSQELHDQPLQDLIHLCRQLDAGALDGAREVATQVVSELRQISRGLRPPSLDDLGLTSALRKLVVDFSARTAIAASVRVEGRSRRLPADVELGLFRIAQEALNNVSRHAAAERVTVRVRFLEDEVRLAVSDDGAGFTPGQAAESSLGLAGMSERAALLGGRLEVISAVAKGTTIRALIPVEAGVPVPV
ncbi:MAG TPA: sensor histidine kinase [Candidatus Dormibacteraeota bacterium]|nr:sensor histidine kinase [Candidatus Dormibacteraeota bacterium]